MLVFPLELEGEGFDMPMSIGGDSSKLSIGTVRHERSG